jgi:hypothetical protein
MGKQKYDVSEDTIQSTYGCLKNFACLEGKAELCDVERYLNNEVLFIGSDGKNICNYRMSYGDSYMCCCPVRKELHRKYNI